MFVTDDSGGGMSHIFCPSVGSYFQLDVMTLFSCPLVCCSTMHACVALRCATCVGSGACYLRLHEARHDINSIIEY